VNPNPHKVKFDLTILTQNKSPLWTPHPQEVEINNSKLLEQHQPRRAKSNQPQ